MANQQRTWTPKMLEEVGILIQSGKTFSQIAVIIGVTRMAVAGAVNRHLNVTRNKAPKEDKKTQTDIFINLKKKSQKLPHELVISHKPKPFPSEGCLSIIGDVKNLKCCGLPREKEKSWCSNHCDLYYEARKNRRQHV